MKKFFILFTLLIMSCYSATYIADVDIQYDPLVRINKETSLIYIDNKNLPQGVESRKLEFYLKENLKKHFYRLTENQKEANVILKLDNKKIEKKRVYFTTVPEETEVKKSTYDNKKKDSIWLLPEPKSKTTYTTYKKVPVEGTYQVYNIQLTFIKLNKNEKIEAIKAQMEVEVDDFEKNIEIFTSKFIEEISFDKEVINTRKFWKQK